MSETVVLRQKKQESRTKGVSTMREQVQKSSEEDKYEVEVKAIQNTEDSMKTRKKTSTMGSILANLAGKTLLAAAFVFVAGLGTATVTAGLIAGQAVNVDLESGTGGYGYNGQGALTTLGNNWNAILPSANSATNLLDSQNNATDVGFSIGEKSGAWAYDVNNNLLRDYWNLNTNIFGGPTTLTISGLDSSRPHELYIYSQGAGAGQGGMFTVGGETKTATSSDPLTDTFVEGQNYVAFYNILPVDGEIVVTWARRPGIQYSSLNGFQVTAIPEPSTLVLLGLAGLVLMRRRK